MNKQDFKSALYSIVARCHVADSHKTAFEYAKSRLKKGHWEKQTPEYQRAFAQACAELHEENRQLYTSVINEYTQTFFRHPLRLLGTRCFRLPSTLSVPVDRYSAGDLVSVFGRCGYCDCTGAFAL